MTHTLHQGDCLEVIPTLAPVDCIFADPFDNIGLGYDQYNDHIPEGEYVEFLDDLVTFSAALAPIIWISLNAKWTFAMGSIFYEFLSRNKDWEAKSCVQVFTFGQHNKNDLGNNHRPLWRLKHRDAPLYPEQIKVPSWRQRNGDPRAAAGGRVPSDVLDMQYPVFGGCYKITYLRGDEEVEELVTNGEVHSGNVFDFPRVTGNSKQRCDWHPTQLHEDLVERCIKLSTKEGGSVLDPFGGTGTTLRVCKKIDRSCTLIELDPFYCSKIREEHPDVSYKMPAAA